MNVVALEAVSEVAGLDAPNPNNAGVRAGDNKSTVGGEGRRPALLTRAVEFVRRCAVLADQRQTDRSHDEVAI